MNLQEQSHKDQNKTDGMYNLYIWKISFILDINLCTLDQRLEEVISPFSDRRDRKLHAQLLLYPPLPSGVVLPCKLKFKTSMFKV